MSDIICVTARRLCRGDFLERIEQIAENHPAAVILREKDMQPEGYEALARQVTEICGRHGVQCILHGFADAALRLNADALHMPLPLLRKMTDDEKSRFRIIGASCHSVEEAEEARLLGCTYISAGHVFETDCKRGMPGRGTEFLRSVCSSSDIPVYGIGGINAGNIGPVRAAGAAGACIMSSMMTTENVKKLFESLEK